MIIYILPFVTAIAAVARRQVHERHLRPFSVCGDCLRLFEVQSSVLSTHEYFFKYAHKSTDVQLSQLCPEPLNSRGVQVHPQVPGVVLVLHEQVLYTASFLSGMKCNHDNATVRWCHSLRAFPLFTVGPWACSFPRPRRRRRLRCFRSRGTAQRR